MARTTQKVFTGKKVRFFGLKSVILLSKMGERALDSLKFILIWELLIGIYEGFMKSFHSLLLPEKSYSQLKNQEKSKNYKSYNVDLNLGPHEPQPTALPLELSCNVI